MTKRRRPRDYKAEYKRRIAKGVAAGRSRQQARGHKIKEHVERRRRAILKYGGTPSQLTHWRRAAFENARQVLGTAARNPIDERTLKRGVRLLHLDDLKALAEMDPFAVASAVKIDGAHIAALEEYFPASMDAIEAEEHNPLWYHS